MNLRCQHCGERIVARGFGKCPGCHRDLPEELQLSPKEKELEEMEETWRSMAERRNQLGTIEIFPTIFIPKEKELQEKEETCRRMDGVGDSLAKEGGAGPSLV